MSSNVSLQPDIAGCINAVRIAAENHGISLEAAVDAVVYELGLHTSGEAPDVSFAEAASKALSMLAKTPIEVSIPENSGSTTDAVSQMLLGGADGEAFAWEVIRFESQFHIGLAWMEANRVAKNQSNRTAEDLLGWGWLGLRQAMRQFNPGLGYKFSTYAVVRIKGSIRDGIRSENPIPKRLLTLQRKVDAVSEELSLTLGRAPSIEELSLAVEQPVSVLSDLLPRLRSAASVDEIMSLSEEEGSLISPDLYADSDPYEAAESEERSRAIAEALKSIDPRLAECVSMVVCQGLSVAETRRRIGVSDREIRRRVEKGIHALGPLLTEWAASR
jgi:RNA polymerase sigma factor for flagellar operon FliA